MTVDKLINLLAEAAVRKLSQEREAKEAAPDVVDEPYAVFRQMNEVSISIVNAILTPCRNHLRIHGSLANDI